MIFVLASEIIPYDWLDLIHCPMKMQANRMQNSEFGGDMNRFY